jgi:hypothetical protein
MPFYRVIVRGRNFRLNITGKWEKFGFCTPRFAEAPNAVLAEEVALGDFRRSVEYLYLLERSSSAKDDEPVLCGEDIAEVPPDQGSAEGTAGLALYREPDV